MRKPFEVTRNRIPSKGGDGVPLNGVPIQLQLGAVSIPEYQQAPHGQRLIMDVSKSEAT